MSEIKRATLCLRWRQRVLTGRRGGGGTFPFESFMVEGFQLAAWRQERVRVCVCFVIHKERPGQGVAGGWSSSSTYSGSSRGS